MLDKGKNADKYTMQTRMVHGDWKQVTLDYSRALLFRCDSAHQRVLGSQHGKGHAVHSIWARGKDSERGVCVSCHLQFKVHTLTAADPVALHGQDMLRPIQVVGLGQ